MKRRSWLGATVLMMVGAAVVLTVWVSPLNAQDHGQKVQTPAKHLDNSLVDAAVPRAAVIADTHRVSWGRVGLPGDTHLTSPITFGVPDSGAGETGAARRRAQPPAYRNITLGGSITAQHDMLDMFRQYFGQAHTLSITIFSTGGDELSKVEAVATMVEVSLDLEARTWQIMFALHSEE